MEREAAIVVIAGEIVRILRNTGERQRGMTLVEHHLIRPDVRVIDLETQIAERAGQEIERLLESGFDALQRGLFGITRPRDGERGPPLPAVAPRHPHATLVTGVEDAVLAVLE